ncbi:MAG: septum formation initiator family protein [Clostridia bacterium]|nr:septum formation initiator family protein [Clostridia bacterium]MBQ4602754.1 septum formation initiator family protein [Clostridia bacterium]
MTRTNIFVRIAVIIVIVVCLITILKLQIQFNRLNEEKKVLSAQVEEYQEDIEELKAEIERPFDDEYVIRVAREKLGYHLPDEIIYYNDLN